MPLLQRLMLKQFGIVPTHPVSVQRDIKVRMPDGAELLTDVYLGNRGERAPVILLRSPYGKGAMLTASNAYPLATQGYNVVIQTCRGTFGSTGRFDPHHDEQRDGLATIEWVKTQPWYGGSIGTFGGSYFGYTQWAVAAAGPEVKAMAMMVTTSDFSTLHFDGGSLALKTAFTWTAMVTKMRGGNLAMLRIILGTILKRPMIRPEQFLGLPLATLDEAVTGKRVGFWQDWMQHASSADPWWAPMSFRSAIPQMKRPITMVAGWFDIILLCQMRDFVALREANCDARITIGPWNHTELGLGKTSLHDAIEWFDQHLRGKQPAARKRVKLFVMGADEWREFDTWPPREVQFTRWYLQPQKALSGGPAPDSPPDRYRYDPADPTPSLGGSSLEGTPYSVDNTVLEARPDVLTYTSTPLSQAREIIGPVQAELYVSSSAPSADFFVRVCDVDRNGVSTNICDGLQRIRIEATDRPQLAHIELSPTAYRFPAGHRIRVQISSGAFPRYARNLGGTEPLGTATRMHAATQSIHHSSTCPSSIILPLYAAG